MRYVLLLSLLLIGCGPSKAEIAAKECRSAHLARSWNVAAASCETALRLDPESDALAELWAEAYARRDNNLFAAVNPPSGLPEAATNKVQKYVSAAYQERLERTYGSPGRDAVADALARQADAAERQAAAMEAAEFRRRMEQASQR